MIARLIAIVKRALSAPSIQSDLDAYLKSNQDAIHSTADLEYHMNAFEKQRRARPLGDIHTGYRHSF